MFLAQVWSSDIEKAPESKGNNYGIFNLYNFTSCLLYSYFV